MRKTFYSSLFELERHSNPLLPWNMQGALSVSARNQPCSHPIRSVWLSRVCLWISSRCIRATVMEYTLFCILHDLRYVLLADCVTLTLYFVPCTFFYQYKFCMRIIISKAWGSKSHPIQCWNWTQLVSSHSILYKLESI